MCFILTKSCGVNESEEIGRLQRVIMSDKLVCILKMNRINESCCNNFKKIIKLDCQAVNGLPTCCSSLNVTNHKYSTKTHSREQQCHFSKKYFPSDYEMLHEQMALEINDDINKLKEFLHSHDEIKRTLIWLQRVKLRMSSPEELAETEDDRKYLSRFEISRHCSGRVVSKWIEWIEPLIIQSRHPFSIIPPAGHNEDLMSSDYVLFASSNHLKSQYGKHTGSSYFIDAGNKLFVIFLNEGKLRVCICGYFSIFDFQKIYAQFYFRSRQ